MKFSWFAIKIDTLSLKLSKIPLMCIYTSLHHPFHSPLSSSFSIFSTLTIPKNIPGNKTNDFKSKPRESFNPLKSHKKSVCSAIKKFRFNCAKKLGKNFHISWCSVWRNIKLIKISCRQCILLFFILSVFPLVKVDWCKVECKLKSFLFEGCLKESFGWWNFSGLTLRIF